jgi:hypothetical protein
MKKRYCRHCNTDVEEKMIEITKERASDGRMMLRGTHPKCERFIAWMPQKSDSNYTMTYGPYKGVGIPTLLKVDPDYCTELFPTAKGRLRNALWNALFVEGLRVTITNSRNLKSKEK